MFGCHPSRDSCASYRRRACWVCALALLLFGFVTVTFADVPTVPPDRDTSSDSADMTRFVREKLLVERTPADTLDDNPADRIRFDDRASSTGRVDGTPGNASDTERSNSSADANESSNARRFVPRWSAGSGATGDELETSAALGEKSWVLETITALGIVIGLIFVVRFAWLKMSGPRTPKAGAGRVVEVLSRTTIAPRNHVLLLRLGSRILVVGDSSAGMQTLTTIDEPQEVADLLGAIQSTKSTSISRGFSDLVSRFNRDYESDAEALDESVGEDEFMIDRAQSQLSGLLSRVRTAGVD